MRLCWLRSIHHLYRYTCRLSLLQRPLLLLLIYDDWRFTTLNSYDHTMYIAPRTNDRENNFTFAVYIHRQANKQAAKPQNNSMRNNIKTTTTNHRRCSLSIHPAQPQIEWKCVKAARSYTGPVLCSKHYTYCHFVFVVENLREWAEGGLINFNDFFCPSLREPRAYRTEQQLGTISAYT